MKLQMGRTGKGSSRGIDEVVAKGGRMPRLGKLEARIETLGAELERERLRRRSLETELERLRAEAEATFEDSPVLFLLVDREGRLRKANRSALEFIGCSLDEALGRKVEDLLSFCVHDPLGEAEGPETELRHSPILISLEETCRSGRRHEKVEAPVRYTVGRSTGRRQFLVTTTPLTVQGDELVLLCLEDLTVVKSLEREIGKTARLESLGVLAGGIAHDVNNILTVILGNVTIGKLRCDIDDPVRMPLEAVQRAALEAADLTNKLLTFSRGGAPIKRALDLGEVVAAAADAVLRGSEVGCEHVTAETRWPIDGDADQLREALESILENAVQSMGGKGSIRISLDDVVVDEGSILPLCAGAYLRLRLTDFGKGIKPSECERVLDPFFTTKAGAHGLGLTAAYSIVRRHDGHLSIASEEERGTTVTIYLPRREGDEDGDLLGAGEPPLDETGVDQTEELIAGGLGEEPAVEGSILLVDDDLALLEATSEMLSFLGWNVTIAREGAEAVRHYEERLAAGQPFDVVILDLTIEQGMGGQECIRYLLEVDPEVTALVSSGYHNDPILANHWEYGFSGVIAKPYMLHEIDDAIRAARDGKIVRPPKNE